MNLAKTKIIQQLGYFPAFLNPAIEFPEIFRSLVRQTFLAYELNPLPSVFKEKLFVYISRYYGLGYFTICHSCTLRSHNISASEILALGEIPYPQSTEDIQSDLTLLNNPSEITEKSTYSHSLESSLLRCSILIFSAPSKSENCMKVLQKLLGAVKYNYLILLLGYIKLCHHWVKNHPQISHEQDNRSQLYLGSLLLSKPKLAIFFQSKVTQTFIPETANEHKLRSNSSSLRLKLKPKATIEKHTTLKSQSENLETFTNYLENLPFPAMISNDLEEILFLNHSWLKVTGSDLADVDTLDECQQQSQVKVESASIAKLLAANLLANLNTAKAVTTSTEYCATQIKKIAAETSSSLQQIIDFLIVLAAGMPLDNIKDTCQREISLVTREGKKRFWQVHSTTFSYGNNNQTLKICIFKDITDIYQANLKLELLSEATQTGTWNWNLERNQIDISDHTYHILGLESFDGSYESFLSSVHPQERESVDLSIIKTIQANQNLDLEYQIVHSNQEVYWIRTRGELSFDEEGKVIGIQGIVTDTTQYKNQASLATTTKSSIINHNRAYKAIVSPQQFEQMFAVSPHYAFVVDIATKAICQINHGLVKAFGLSNIAEIKGRQMFECFPANYIKQIGWQHQQVLTYGETLHLQEEVILADGTHYFNTIITPIKNDQGEITALLHTSNDIPNLAATQEALSERTQQLEAANRELESFSYSVSHDLQAPLRVINGFSQVLWETCKDSLDERGQHFIERIQANSQKMSDLIDALLELSRVTRSQMKSVKVNLSDMAKDILQELQTEDPHRQVEIKVKPELEVQGDPQLLRIVLDNLLNNAWKYTSKRSQAQIEFNLLIDNNAESIYFVRDNGAGFDQDYVDKLFTAFQRLHCQSEFPGTGIGLATVQRIVYRHGGRVWAEGERDRGATIYFAL